MVGEPPLECPGCEFLHQSRPPVVGVNHMSQLLCGLDLFMENQIEAEEFEAIFESFLEFFDQLEQKWRLRDATLAERLSPALFDKFQLPFQQLDLALQDAYQGIELVESALAGEEVKLDEAADLLVKFFRGICGAAAQILEQVDEFDNNKGSGVLFNLPSV